MEQKQTLPAQFFPNCSRLNDSVVFSLCFRMVHCAAVNKHSIPRIIPKAKFSKLNSYKSP